MLILQTLKALVTFLALGAAAGLMGHYLGGFIPGSIARLRLKHTDPELHELYKEPSFQVMTGISILIACLLVTVIAVIALQLWNRDAPCLSLAFVGMVVEVIVREITRKPRTILLLVPFLLVLFHFEVI